MRKCSTNSGDWTHRSAVSFVCWRSTCNGMLFIGSSWSCRRKNGDESSGNSSRIFTSKRTLMCMWEHFRRTGVDWSTRCDWRWERPFLTTRRNVLIRWSDRFFSLFEYKVNVFFYISYKQNKFYNRTVRISSDFPSSSSEWISVSRTAVMSGDMRGSLAKIRLRSDDSSLVFARDLRCKYSFTPR